MRRLLASIALVTLLSPSHSRPQVTAPVKPDSVRMAVIGDMGTGETPQYDVSRRMTEAHAKFPFDFVIMLGDNIWGSKPKILNGSFPFLISRCWMRVKFYASLGNHDTNESFYAPFNMNGLTYFQKGNVRSLRSSNYMEPKQLAWLENELKGIATEVGRSLLSSRALLGRNAWFEHRFEAGAGTLFISIMWTSYLRAMITSTSASNRRMEFTTLQKALRGNCAPAI
jgi:hypothetical protein